LARNVEIKARLDNFDQQLETSEYYINETVEPETLRQALTKSLGEYAEVNKTRLLFLVGRTRIHLDRVDALGDFLELEVVLAEDDDLADGHAEAQQLMEQLQVGPEALIDCAYVDLLSDK